MTKCANCPLLNEDRECPGQRNKAVCARSHRPGILRQILSFGQAVVQHVAAGRPMAIEEVKVARLAICQGCDQFDAATDRCSQCGCGLSLKASWADQSCPLEPPKWGPVTDH